jgi:hypothetical protein
MNLKWSFDLSLPITKNQKVLIKWILPTCDIVECAGYKKYFFEDGFWMKYRRTQFHFFFFSNLLSDVL